MIPKTDYYLNFTDEQFLGAKEILKSMPVLYSNVYFPSKYASIMLHGPAGKTLDEVPLICNIKEINNIRQIIKNNFLYLSDWDSAEYIEDKDYGFSFIAGHIKYTVVPYEETKDGYHFMSYDVQSGICADTNIKTSNAYYFGSSISGLGETIKYTEFDLDKVIEDNSVKFLAPKKNSQDTGTYISNKRGYALTNISMILFILMLCLITFGVSMIIISIKLS